MKIIILGAGQVGGTLAEHLASEANDITVVDTDGERLRNLGDRLDIRTVQGRASFPTVLRQAGADDADMLVAVTNSDETNMVACQVAHTLFHTPTKIARVREAAYLTRAGLFDNDAIPVPFAPYGQPQLSFAPVSMGNMDAVDVVRGGGAVRYGPQNVGGIVNFVTRAIPVEPTVKVGVQTETSPSSP